MAAPLIPAIPTIYRGITFRSRLEAKWAYMFDALHWQWEYEPIDLKGYIPDFILQFHQRVLVEVKPAMTSEDCWKYIPKLHESGWTGEALIFGAALKLSPLSFQGPECCLYGQSNSSIPTGELAWGPGELFKCGICHQFSIYHIEQRYSCIVNGCYDGQSHLGGVSFDEIHSLWAKAGEAVRFMPDRRAA